MHLRPVGIQGPGTDGQVTAPGKSLGYKSGNALPLIAVEILCIEVKMLLGQSFSYVASIYREIRFSIKEKDFS
jgi:hypothetical protein